MLVLSVDSENEFADVLLVHSAPELATDSDGVLNNADLNLPYPLIVQTDLRAVVWTLQIREAVGRVSDDVFTQLNNIVRGVGPAAESGVTTGFALSGPTDRRWMFKQDEGHALRRLAHECTSALLDQGLIWEVDARLLNPELLTLADDPLGLLLELNRRMRASELTLSPSDFDFIAALVERLDRQSWGEFADIGVELTTSLAELLHDSMDRGHSDSGSSRRLVTATHFYVSTDAAQFEAVRVLGLFEGTNA